MSQKHSNQNVKDCMEKYDLKQCQLANYIGVNRFTLSHWLSKPLTIDRKARIDDGINQLAKDKKNQLNDLVKG